jgi:hypothetical protein
MAWLKKKPDLISDRARVLTDEIERLEAQIKELDGRLNSDPGQPRMGSTALPHGATLSHPEPAPAPPSPLPAPVAADPIFEKVGQERLTRRNDAPTTPEHFNDLGVRKYDLPALFRRMRGHFQGPAASNPRLVSYLAAGGIQGLRPLRYEKRVARNRFIALVSFLFLMLLGLILVFLRRQ